MGAKVKKIVLKTIAITLAGILLCAGILYGALALFSPITLATFFDDMGMYSASIRYYEKNFEKTNTFGDLDKLVIEIDLDKDSDIAEKYLKLLVESEQFDKFCELKDQLSPSQISAKEYYLGEYVYALCKNDKFEDAVEIASNYVTESGYTKDNPIRIMVFNAQELLGEQQIYALKQKIYEIRARLDGEEQTIASLDISILAELA